MSVPNDSTVESRNLYVALIPFAIAVVATATAACLGHLHPLVFAAALAILVFDLPACMYILIAWLRAGGPPEVSLAPLFPSSEEQRFHRRLRERPKLDDEQFYEGFFANSGVPKQLPIRLRASLEQMLGLDLGALHPDDNIAQANDELDLAELIQQIEDDFDVPIPKESWKSIDGTFDSLLKSVWLASRLESK